MLGCTAATTNRSAARTATVEQPSRNRRATFDSPTQIAEAMNALKRRLVQAVKLLPQPQLFVLWGLMKLKPWRMIVSSKSSTMPLR